MQEALKSDEAQQIVRLIADLVEALEAYFEKRNLLVNVSFRSQPPPGYLGTITVNTGRFSVLLH